MRSHVLPCLDSSHRQPASLLVAIALHKHWVLLAPRVQSGTRPSGRPRRPGDLCQDAFLARLSRKSRPAAGGECAQASKDCLAACGRAAARRRGRAGVSSEESPELRARGFELSRSLGKHERGADGESENSAMAKYFLHVKVFSRGKGSRVTRASAYRGESLRGSLEFMKEFPQNSHIHRPRAP